MTDELTRKSYIGHLPEAAEATRLFKEALEKRGYSFDANGAIIFDALFQLTLSHLRNARNILRDGGYVYAKEIDKFLSENFPQ